MDLLLAILIAITLFYAMLVWTGQTTASHNALFEQWENEKNAVFLADTLIKNRNESNPMLGSAVWDAQKHRVKANELDMALLQKISDIPLHTPVFFRKLRIDFFDGTKMQILESKGIHSDCVLVERVVLVDNQKALLQAVVCRD